MSRQGLFSGSALFATLAVAVFLIACSSSSSHSGGIGSRSIGGYAAGIGGAAQTSAAHILVAVQVPGGTPFAAMINSTGTLTQGKVTENQHSESNPMAMSGAIDPSGSFFYQAVQPGLWAFTIDRQTGNLTEMSTSPYEDSVKFDSVAVDQLGKFVYAYDDSGNVYAYTMQAGTGQLSPIAGSPFAAASSGQQFAIGSNRIAVSQDDKYLYVATGAGIVAYSIDSTTGALTTVNGSPFGAAAGSGFAIVAPSSGFLYETILTNTQTSPAIYGYSIDPTTGALASISGSPFGPGCGSGGPSSPASGAFLFAAGCGMYQINVSNGALTFLSKDPEAVNNDVWAAFDPTSSVIWIVTTEAPCFHCEVGTVTYQVDSTGNMTLTPSPFFPMTNSEVGGIQEIVIAH